MPSASRILKRRAEAKEALSKIFDSKEFYSLIHYSCESFYDRPEGQSPRITSIAIRKFSSAQTKSFSIHQFAEIKKVSIDKINFKYDEYEKDMLDAFYKFINEHKTMKFIHWNMRDINYGFEAIAHRYKVLGGNPVEISDANLVDLSRVLIDLYTPKYIGHPRLKELIDYNDITTRDFLSGKEEARAFEDQEYVKLHQSTLRKVDIFANILSRLEDNSLKTKYRLWSLVKLYPQLLVEKIKEHWIISLISIIISIAGLVVLIKKLFK